MISLTLDGDKWCALIGENLQSGIAGFADDPASAVIRLKQKSEIETSPPVPSEFTDWKVGDVSDGFHSFDQIYEHRCLLFLATIAAFSNQKTIAEHCWKSRLHHNGEMFDGWFVAGINLQEAPISYHLPLRMWNGCVALEIDRAPEWDGYTSQDVSDRLSRWLGIDPVPIST